GCGAPGVQAGNFVVLFGAIDRLGGSFVLAAVGEFAPFVTAIILAGGAGTAITADLGARKIREERDALQVLGVDPVKNLVVPRFLALMIVTALFDVYAILFGIAGGILATLSFQAPLGPFFSTLLTNASTTDLRGSMVSWRRCSARSIHDRDSSGARRPAAVRACLGSLSWKRCVTSLPSGSPKCSIRSRNALRSRTSTGG